MLKGEKHPREGGGELGFSKTFSLQQIQTQYKQEIKR